MPTISVYISDELASYVSSKENKSIFISQLIMDDMTNSKKTLLPKPVQYQKMKEELDKEAQAKLTELQLLEKRKNEILTQEESDNLQLKELEEKRERRHEIRKKAIKDYALENYQVILNDSILEDWAYYYENNDKANAEDFLIDREIITKEQQEEKIKEWRKEHGKH